MKSKTTRGRLRPQARSFVECLREFLKPALWQGQLQLTPYPHKDLQQVVVVPAAGLALHGDAEFFRMLFQKR